MYTKYQKTLIRKFVETAIYSIEVSKEPPGYAIDLGLLHWVRDRVTKGFYDKVLCDLEDLFKEEFQKAFTWNRVNRMGKKKVVSYLKKFLERAQEGG